MEEEQKTVQDQETFKVDVNNIAKIYIWRPMYEVIDALFVEETSTPPTAFFRLV